MKSDTERVRKIQTFAPNTERNRTKCPAHGALTVRDALELPEILAGRPQLVAGAHALDTKIRWVHVLESSTVMDFLSGGELVLSTAVGWGADIDFQHYVRSLVASGIAGLVLELGNSYRQIPQGLAKACEQHRLPLIALHQRTRFVTITEAVHRALLSEQMHALQARDAVSSHFSELMNIGSPVQHIVAEASRILGATVVLEDLAHQVVSHARRPGQDDGFLKDWRVNSRLALEHPVEGRASALVRARGKQWGRIVVLGGKEHPAGTGFVLAQAATALSMELLGQHHGDYWTKVSHQQLLEKLLDRQLSSWNELEHEFEAAGFEFSGRKVLGLAIELPDVGGEPGSPGVHAEMDSLRSAAASLGLDVLCAARQSTVPVILAALSFRASANDQQATLTELLKRQRVESIEPVRATAGTSSTNMQGLLVSLEEAIALLSLGSGPESTRVIARPRSRELALLLHSMRAEPSTRGFPERILGPVLLHDARTGSDLLRTLLAYLKHPTNRTLAAAESHLSRSVFYQRLAVIEELLGRRLDDGQELATLQVAAMIHRQSGSA